jgi:glycosyltransferase involved in cell wall biosynthesis
MKLAAGCSQLAGGERRFESENGAMKVTVLPTITAYPWGAPGHCMGVLVEELIEAGHQVQWFVAPIDREHAEVRDLAPRCSEFHLLPDQPPFFSRFAEWRQRWLPGRRQKPSLVRQVEAFAPRHIFVNQGGMWCALQRPDLSGLLARRANDYTLICHLNVESPAMDTRSVEAAGALFVRARRVFVNSDYMLDLAKIQLASDIPNARHYHLPHRFDFAAPIPWPRSAEARLAFVGRLDTHHKGLDLALCALKELMKEGARFRFTLYGEGPDREYLGQLVRHFGLEDQVVFAGYATRIQDIWEENEILFMPSRHEGCAVAMTEAIGFGRPVVATAVGGAPEWVEDSVTGFLAAAPTVALVAEALRRAISQRNSWRQLGEAAHRKFKATMPPRPAKVFLEALRP